MSVEGEFFEYGIDVDENNLIWYDPCCDYYMHFSRHCDAFVGKDAMTGEMMLMVRPNVFSIHVPIRFCPCCGAKARYIEEDDMDGHNDCDESLE